MLSLNAQGIQLREVNFAKFVKMSNNLNPFGLSADVNMISKVSFTDPVSGESYSGLPGFKNFLIDKTGQIANAPDHMLSLKLYWSPTGNWILADSSGAEFYMSQDYYKMQLI